MRWWGGRGPPGGGGVNPQTPPKTNFVGYRNRPEASLDMTGSIVTSGWAVYHKKVAEGQYPIQSTVPAPFLALQKQGGPGSAKLHITSFVGR